MRTLEERESTEVPRTKTIHRTYSSGSPLTPAVIEIIAGTSKRSATTVAERDQAAREAEERRSGSRNSAEQDQEGNI